MLRANVIGNVRSHKYAYPVCMREKRALVVENNHQTLVPLSNNAAGSGSELQRLHRVKKIITKQIQVTFIGKFYF